MEVIGIQNLESVFVVLNTVCGFFQIVLLFLFKPFGYLFAPLAIIVFFVLGYYTKVESSIDRFDGLLIYAAFMFLLNLVSFTIFSLLYFEEPRNSMIVGTIVTGMTVTASFNFNELGNLIGRIRNVS